MADLSINENTLYIEKIETAKLAETILAVAKSCNLKFKCRYSNYNLSASSRIT